MRTLSPGLAPMQSRMAIVDADSSSGEIDAVVHLQQLSSRRIVSPDTVHSAATSPNSR